MNKLHSPLSKKRPERPEASGTALLRVAVVSPYQSEAALCPYESRPLLRAPKARGCRAMKIHIKIQIKTHIKIKIKRKIKIKIKINKNKNKNKNKIKIEIKI